MQLIGGKIEQASEREQLISSIRVNKLAGYPIETLTEELLISRNEMGETPLHSAAIYECIGNIPSQFLNQKNLMLLDGVDGGNASVLAYVVMYDCLEQLPKEVLTESLLLTPNATGQTILYSIAEANHLDQILGVELSKKCESMVGKEWYAKNNAVLLDKEALEAEKEIGQEIDLF